MGTRTPLEPPVVGGRVLRGRAGSGSVVPWGNVEERSCRTARCGIALGSPQGELVAVDVGEADLLELGGGAAGEDPVAQLAGPAASPACVPQG